ncbi:hypothetical protein ACQJBY_063317 [Aegilops geniculata]
MSSRPKACSHFPPDIRPRARQRGAPASVGQHGPHRPVAGGDVLRVGTPAGARPPPPSRPHGRPPCRARRRGLRAARHRPRSHASPPLRRRRGATSRGSRPPPIHRPHRLHRPLRRQPPPRTNP